MKEFELTYDELVLFVQHFAAKLKPNTTILLNGEIGAGKTTWTKLLFQALGYTGVVSSPTFNLIKQYDGRHYHLTHVDAYRNVQGGYIALDEYLERPYVLCIEWSAYIKDEIPEAYICIHIAYSDLEKRIYTIELHDERYQEEDFGW